MSLSTHCLEYGRHVARLRRRRRRRAYAPTSNTASHDDHEKINSWVSFCFPYEYGAPLGGPLELRFYYYCETFNFLYIKEARKGFSLHAHAQSTPRCTRQLSESK